MITIEQLRACAASGAAGPLVVYSDLYVASVFIELSANRKELLTRHLSVLEQVADGRSIWMPTFNYDFLRAGTFNASDSPCQLGPLGEHFRTSKAAWRTVDPVFSFAGTGPNPTLEHLESRIDPFGSDSVFAEQVRRRAVILYYGASFSSTTFIHYLERVVAGPPYRYDKIFRGVVRDSKGERDVEYVYHVRPVARTLDYDWKRLYSELSEAGIVRGVFWKNRYIACAVDADSLNQFWGERLKLDSLYFLDESTRAWVEPLLSRLGRGFFLEDFESKPAGVRTC
jgi:aminoglycoside 3-N-acetyltransferase